MTLAAHPAIPARSSASEIFSTALLAATVVPFISIAANGVFSGAAALAMMLLMIAAGHVVATAYLLTDIEVRGFFLAHPSKMIVMPIALVVGGLVLFSQTTGIARTGFFSLFFVYQAWHFGAQNIGVSSFISLAERRRPLSRIEKMSIKCGIVVGMLGVLQAMSSVFRDDPLASIEIAAIRFCYEVGAMMAIPLAATAIWMMLREFQDRKFRFGVSLALSICFLFPMYVTHDYLLGYVSFTIAHGVQYVIFLFAHGVGELRATSGATTRKFGALGILATAVLIGSLIWNTGAVQSIPTIGLAIIPALTLAHFWVDLFLWRMRDKDRAAWLRTRFGYVM